MKKILAALGAAAFMMMNITALSADVHAGTVKDEGFVRTSGRTLVCEDGSEYLIKGIAMGNDVWSAPVKAPTYDHSENSFRELSKLGFNCVRFYLNYDLFESDSAPYKYRKEGFDWIDQNIKWAKKYDMRIILNMHCPQGGYQSQGNGDTLWKSKSAQNRLIALWGKIAQTYADEPVILGYGLVNEPFPVGEKNAADGIRVWQELAQKITDRIRKYDRNHIVIAEKAMAVKDPDTGEPDWSLSDDEQFIILDDSNAMYEFHTYEPFSFTHQGFEWAGTGGTQASYPSDEIIASGLQWLSCTGKKAIMSDTGWQRIETDKISVDDSRANVIAVSFQGADLGANGAAFADEIYLDEYDASGRLIRTLPCETDNYSGSFGFWSQNGSGSGGRDDSIGYNDKQCLSVRGTTGDANLSLIRIKHTDGHKYRVRGYVKLENASRGKAALRIDLYKARTVSSVNRELLEKSVGHAVKFSEKENVPVFCGEFGAGINCFKENRGGTQWVSDMIDILTENRIGYDYHAFNDGSFGLYRKVKGKLVKNEELEKVFEEKLKS